MSDDPLLEDWSDEQVAVMHAMHAMAVSLSELDQQLAVWMGLPTSDASALGHIVWADASGAPLAPGELAGRLGMTSGATTLLLHRLERAGHVRRSRESDDRRRVTLRPSPEAREQARAFTAASGQELAAAVRGSERWELDVVTAFLKRITEATEAGRRRLHDQRRASSA